MSEQYRIDGVEYPQPDSTEWQDQQNGVQLSTNLPIYSAYRKQVWRYPVLPNCDFAAGLEAIRNQVLTSLTTDPPSDAEVLAQYDDAKVVNIRRTHSWGHPRGIDITFEILV